MLGNLAAIALPSADGALRPLKPDVVPSPPWLALAGLLLLSIAAALLIWRRQSTVLESPGTGDTHPERPETLRERLEALRSAGWIEKGDPLKACDAMADAMRDLVRIRFGVLSRRLTSAELLTELADRGAEPGFLQPLGDVLEACDLVKFASVKPLPTELRGHLETAIILVDSFGLQPVSFESPQPARNAPTPDPYLERPEPDASQWPRDQIQAFDAEVREPDSAPPSGDRTWLV